jgi:DNA modification methylase
MDLKYVKLETIIEGERFREEYGDLTSLIESMKSEGIITPIAIKDNGDGTYKLLAGGRRFRAATEACFDEVPCNIYPPTLNSVEERIIELMENVERRDLTWLEQAKLKKEIHRLHIQLYGEKKSTSPDAPGWTLGSTANLFGDAKSTTHRDIKLAEAAEQFPELSQAKSAAEADKMINRISEEMVRGEIARRLLSQKAETPIEVQKRELINAYMVGDCFDIMKGMPDRSIDIVEIDPPYAIALEQMKQGIQSHAYKQDTYKEVPVEEYNAFLENLLRESYRIMSDNSWLILWFGPDPWFETVYQTAMRAGFKGSRMFGYWNKEGMSTGQSMQPNLYLSNIGEPFFYLRKGEPAITKQGRGNVFNFKAVHSSRKVHPTERPIELIQEILYTFSWGGARMFVPFLGSGNSILAGANLGIKGMGCDLVASYKDPYTIKVYNSVPGEYTSYVKA